MQFEKIYFDMDGVLADFNRGLVELCGLPIIPEAEETDENQNRMWDEIRSLGHFYDMLQPMPGAVELFNTLRAQYGSRVEILSAPPKAHRGIVNAESDKRAWVRRLLGEDVAVNIVYKEHKKDFCTGAGCVLIDDLEKNINAWREAGGTGIRHTSPEATLAEIRRLEAE